MPHCVPKKPFSHTHTALQSREVHRSGCRVHLPWPLHSEAWAAASLVGIERPPSQATIQRATQILLCVVCPQSLFDNLHVRYRLLLPGYSPGASPQWAEQGPQSLHSVVHPTVLQGRVCRPSPGHVAGVVPVVVALPGFFPGFLSLFRRRSFCRRFFLPMVVLLLVVLSTREEL